MAELGDPDFELFARAEIPRLMRLARVLAGNEHDAWDLVQECLVRVGSRWHSIRNRHESAAYARKALVNLNLNRLRAARREVLGLALTETTGPRTRTSSEGPDLEWLDEALSRLSPKQRAAITLAYLYELPVVDIAGDLGCSVSAAKTHLSRGRDALRAAATQARVTHAHDTDGSMT